eukprot:CAMPEP_0175106448 /NCGR_PEP_ID=MMETSP0086_2-20121207/11204_1 /TAXON_ID=136419 /ORGANISM="Unknown Unknown, Strain D1" /LENGTH=67 /DNA_ID=CAMNT_0016382783 /DNA_START=278 /DNA_END=478 /DNA_ORIENTATION=+
MGDLKNLLTNLKGRTKCVETKQHQISDPAPENEKVETNFHPPTNEDSSTKKESLVPCNEGSLKAGAK